MSARSRLLLALVSLTVPLASLGAEPRVFIQTEVSPQDPYVQAATRVTVSLYSARALYHPELDLSSSAAALVHQVGTDERSTIRRDDRLYDVLTRHYLLFAQRSGVLSIPGATLNAQVLTSVGRAGGPGGDLAGNTLGAPYSYGAMAVAVEPLELHGEPIALRVRPRPPGVLGSYWVPAEQFWMSAAWHPSSLTARVGDAINLELSMQARGLEAEQLPDLSMLLGVPAGVKAYADEPKLDTAVQGDTLVATREQNIALIADRAGRFNLPALEVRWWDTSAGAVREAELPARELDILPAAGAPATAARATAAAEVPVKSHGLLQSILRIPAGGSSSGNAAEPWRTASMVLAVLWVATLIAWLTARRSRRGSPQAPVVASSAAPHEASRARSRAECLKACRRDDARAARRHLLAWLAAQWPATAPSGLIAAGRAIGEPRVVPLLKELDRACYGGGAWRGDALAEVLERLRLHAPRDLERAREIASLYP